jgi:ATP-dependent Lon protease
MTDEIPLIDQVLPRCGLKEKIPAAHCGASKCTAAKENVPENVKTGTMFGYVGDVNEVLHAVFKGEMVGGGESLSPYSDRCI